MTHIASRFGLRLTRVNCQKGLQVKMGGKSSTPEQTAQVIAMREAGYTSAMIKERTGLSIATITRLSAKHGAKKGSAQAALVEEAKRELSEAVLSDSCVKELTTRLLADNLSHVEIGRHKMLEAIECLTPSDTSSAAITLRACAAYFTAIKASSDALRPLCRELEGSADEDSIPELVIRRMTPEEIAALRSAQQEELESMGLSSETGAEDEQLLSDVEE